MNIKRRKVIQGSFAVGAVGVAVGTGLLTPKAALAKWPTSAFQAKTIEEALQGALGVSEAEESSDIHIKAPDIAENGAVVPITVSSTLTGVSSISILADNNPTPLTCSYELPEGTEAFVSTRIKMGKTGNVVAIVKASDKLYRAKKEVKVTIGGCGG